MISVVSTGGTVINYSDRFTLTGMTGIFPANVQTGIKGLSDNKGPAAQNNAAKVGAGVGGAGDATVAYTMQTGATKFAPMQKQPGTKITVKNPSPQYPTSQVQIAKTKLPTPVQQTTITASMTNVVASQENSVGGLVNDI